MTTIKWNNDKVGASGVPFPDVEGRPSGSSPPRSTDGSSVVFLWSSKRNFLHFQALTDQLCAQVLGRFLALHRFRIAHWTSSHAPALALSLHHHILCYSSHLVAPLTQLICMLRRTHDYLFLPCPSARFMHTYISMKSYFIPLKRHYIPCTEASNKMTPGKADLDLVLTQLYLYVRMRRKQLDYVQAVR